MKQLQIGGKQDKFITEASPDEDRRELTARWVITARLTMQSAAQIGSQESDYCDQTFERDEDGNPVLYGTTLAGALRSSLNDQRKGYRSADEATEAYLVFGTLEGEDAHQSQVIVFDSRANTPAETVLRDGVHLDPATRLAVAHHKYDRELTLPGVIFPLRFDLLVPAEAEEQALLEGLSLALEDLAGTQGSGTVSIGARRTRGLGLCIATGFRAERYDLTSLSGWLAYAESGYDAEVLECLPSERESECPGDAIQSAWDGSLRLPSTDRRKQLNLDFDLALESTLLIRSPGLEPGSPDSVHLRESGQDLLSGTAFIGVLKHQVRRVLNTLPLKAEDQRGLLEGLFGPEPDSQSAPQASRVTLAGEPILMDARRYRQTRVAIDRLSSAAVEAALFQEEPCVGGWMRFRIVVRQPHWQNTESDAVLLLLAARDLLENLSTLGGEASIGRGLVSGSVSATFKQQGGEEQVLSITTMGEVADADVERFEVLFLPLREHFLADEARQM
jgi:CRISPR/Cas system CSM-associated protein Csm3 (group 7 of RAMP superfamily)